MRAMECCELVERVTDYLEQALLSDDLTRLNEHVEVCTGCVAHLGAVRVTLRVTSSLPPEPMSSDLESSLLATYLSWAKSTGP